MLGGEESGTGDVPRQEQPVNDAHTAVDIDVDPEVNDVVAESGINYLYTYIDSITRK